MPLKLGLIGYGRMGRCIEEIASSRGHTIVARLSKDSHAECLPIDADSSWEELAGADILIDFSHASIVPRVVDKAIALKKNIVIGTTGWNTELEEIQGKILRGDIAALWSPNFSLGVQLFIQLARQCAHLFNMFEEYDVAGYEIHHNKKADSPSGSAKAIVDTLIAGIDRKSTALFDTINRPIAPHELQWSSLRCGEVPGTHALLFDSAYDTITLRHEARNRNGFAAGAVTAAEWLLPRKGFYTINDLILDKLQR